MAIPVILSFDYDFCFEEDPMLDLGHRESTLFLEGMWSIRAQGWLAKSGKWPEDVIPQQHDPISIAYALWGRLRRQRAQVYLNESHAGIVSAINEIAPAGQMDIVNVDAHWDILYSDSEILTYKEKFNCGSWGAHLIANGRVRDWYQVYPDWRQQHPEGAVLSECNRIGSYTEMYWDQFIRLKLPKAPMLFLCRSGCWVPPVYDLQFNKLAGLFGLPGLPERKFDREAIAAGAEEERKILQTLLAGHKEVVA